MEVTNFQRIFAKDCTALGNSKASFHCTHRHFAQLIPTTPGIVASAAAAQDGAATADILPACLQLVLLTALYLTFLFWRLFAVRRNAL